MKKLLFLLFILFIGIILFVFLDMRYDEAMSVREFNQSQEELREFKIIGKISDISFEDFTVVDLEFPEHSVVYEIDEGEDLLEGFSLGDVVLIKSEYVDDSEYLRALEIEKIEDERTLSQIPVKEPLLQVTVLEYPQELADICEVAEFTLNIENLGEVPISHEDLYDEGFGYTIIYRVNDEERAFLPIEDFGELQPNEEARVSFETHENVNTAMQEGENIIGFDWGKRSMQEDDFTIIDSSERISIFLENYDCE